MRIAVVGLGAIGGYLAARLALAGHEVSGMARGQTLAAVREHGLQLTRDGRTQSVPLAAVSDDARALPAPELVIIALKGPALAQSAATLRPLLGASTMVMPAMNGVPWWFMTGDPRPLRSVDPDGLIGETIALPQVIGCVVHITSSSAAPGRICHGFGERLIIGEPAGGTSARVERVAAALAEAGFSAERSEDIRRDIWFKLWGNMTMNPVSALTGATCDRILDDELVSAFVLRVMAEAQAIGERIGCPIAQSGAERNAVTRKLGAFKTSMLQDVEAGRPIELDALVSAAREIGQRVSIATPDIDALLGLTRLMAQSRGLYGTPLTSA
jgi:2-dehydropantoate 2-reductase